MRRLATADTPGEYRRKTGQWEYKIHYLGWRSSFDEWMPNARVYKKTEQLRELLAGESAEVRMRTCRLIAT